MFGHWNTRLDGAKGKAVLVGVAGYPQKSFFVDDEFIKLIAQTTEFWFGIQLISRHKRP